MSAALQETGKEECAIFDHIMSPNLMGTRAVICTQPERAE